jgi:hypothetical protein
VKRSGGNFFVLATHLGLKFIERRRQCQQLSALATLSTKLQRLDMAWLGAACWPASYLAAPVIGHFRRAFPC